MRRAQMLSQHTRSRCASWTDNALAWYREVHTDLRVASDGGVTMKKERLLTAGLVESVVHST